MCPPHHSQLLAVLSLSFIPATARGGEPSPDIAAAAEAPWILPTLDVRLRYEHADVDGLEGSDALTIRERIGIKTREWHGFSALVEGEFTQVLVDDYSSGAPGTEPFDPAFSPVGDPENAELNQAWLTFAALDSSVKAGRQRIIHDSGAFIGNVGWRQNEQTYDAVTLATAAVPGMTLDYSYIRQVNRIFGEDANGIFENTPGDIHLVHANYTGIKGVTLGGYFYDMSFDDPGTTGWDNRTYGIFAKGTAAGLALHCEIAWQDEAGPLNDREGLYAHFHATRQIGGHAFTLGIEHLDAGVQTPLATVHAFNGYADATDARRIAGTHGGLTDTYLSHTATLPFGLKWTNAVHLFGDNAISNDLGFGFDSVLAKKFDDHFSALAKLGTFETRDALYRTTTRVSVQLDYVF